MKSKNDALTEKDKNLIEAMQMFEKDWIATYPDELELAGKFTYSKRHTKRMNRMLKNHDSLFYRATCTPKRQIAAAILIVLISFNTVMVTSVEARAAVMNFFVTVYETFSDVLFPNDSAPTTIENYYKPSYVPEGYVVDTVEDIDIEFWIDYVNGNGEIISFVQATLNNADLGVDTENTEFEIITISGVEGIIVYNKAYYSLHWSSDEYRFSLVGNNKAEIIQMAESLKIFEKN